MSKPFLTGDYASITFAEVYFNETLSKHCLSKVSSLSIFGTIPNLYVIYKIPMLFSSSALPYLPPLIEIILTKIIGIEVH